MQSCGEEMNELETEMNTLKKNLADANAEIKKLKEALAAKDADKVDIAALQNGTLLLLEQLKESQKELADATKLVESRESEDEALQAELLQVTPTKAGDIDSWTDELWSVIKGKANLRLTRSQVLQAITTMIVVAGYTGADAFTSIVNCEDQLNNTRVELSNTQVKLLETEALLEEARRDLREIKGDFQCIQKHFTGKCTKWFPAAANPSLSQCVAAAGNAAENFLAAGPFSSEDLGNQLAGSIHMW